MIAPQITEATKNTLSVSAMRRTIFVTHYLNSNCEVILFSPHDENTRFQFQIEISISVFSLSFDDDFSVEIRSTMLLLLFTFTPDSGHGGASGP